MTGNRRRDFMKMGVAIGAAAGTFGFGRSALAQTTVSLQLNWIKKVDFAGFYIADDLGYYAAERVNATFLAGGPGMQGVEQIVAGGSANLGLSTVFTSVVQAIQQGTDLVVIGSVLQNSPMGLATKKGTQLRSIKDLVGKRIGGPQGRQRELDAVFRVNGMTPDYKFVPIGFDPTPLIKGDVDMISVFINSEPLTLKSRGFETDLITYTELGLPTYTMPIYGMRRFIDANRATVVSWLRASAKGWEMNAKDPELGPRLTVEKYGKGLGLKPDQSLAENRVFIELSRSAKTAQHGMLWVDKEQISGPIYRGLSAAGFTNLPDPAKYVDTSLIEAAYGGKKTLL